MTWRQAVRSLLISWDWITAAAIVLAMSFLIPSGLTFPLAKEIFGASISVLAIVFSVFFAALAVLITAGDNEFVAFLQEDGSYIRIVWTFKITLLLLSLALLSSLVLFTTSLAPSQLQPPPAYPRSLLLVFGFLGLYALLAAMHSSLDVIRYAQFRADYLHIIEKDKQPRK